MAAAATAPAIFTLAGVNSTTGVLDLRAVGGQSWYFQGHITSGSVTVVYDTYCDILGQTDPVRNSETFSADFARTFPGTGPRAIKFTNTGTGTVIIGIGIVGNLGNIPVLGTSNTPVSTFG